MANMGNTLMYPIVSPTKNPPSPELAYMFCTTVLAGIRDPGLHVPETCSWRRTSSNGYENVCAKIPLSPPVVSSAQARSFGFFRLLSEGTAGTTESRTPSACGPYQTGTS
ncbi:hypothetical protein AYI68_g2066 [Smittium mucronatum]|uniref:Uncharacterized protein n=1 Tax=Smittium mucronatum TaxID=133383 RepID=A0A1R0H3M6_9FUNG|nr:hypothetical protein AYI68_g2066 [Smittium mucronatum]